MSGGHFEYKQYVLDNLIEELRQSKLDEYYMETFGDRFDAYIAEAIDLLQNARILVHRLDWLISGDDGEETFYRRLAEDREKLKDSQCLSST